MMHVLWYVQLLKTFSWKNDLAFGIKTIFEEKDTVKECIQV